MFWHGARMYMICTGMVVSMAHTLPGRACRESELIMKLWATSFIVQTGHHNHQHHYQAEQPS